MATWYCSAGDGTSLSTYSGTKDSCLGACKDKFPGRTGHTCCDLGYNMCNSSPKVVSARRDIRSYKQQFEIPLGYVNRYYTTCKEDGKSCSLLTKYMSQAKEALTKLKHLGASIQSLIDSNTQPSANSLKTKINSIHLQKASYAKEMKELQAQKDADLAAKPMRKQEQKTATSTYLYLAYYFFASMAAMFLLYKQYKFSTMYMLGVVAILIAVAFLARWWNSPYM